MNSISIICFVAVVAAAAAYNPCVGRKYSVILDNTGPSPRPCPIINGPTIVSPTMESPLVKLPFQVPPPRTISNRCNCVKTIVKPQVIQQVVSVPVLKKYIQTLSRPKLETINYIAEPINTPTIESYDCSQ